MILYISYGKEPEAIKEALHRLTVEAKDIEIRNACYKLYARLLKCEEKQDRRGKKKATTPKGDD